jgi:hypothetical protein
MLGDSPSEYNRPTIGSEEMPLQTQLPKQKQVAALFFRFYTALTAIPKNEEAAEPGEGPTALSGHSGPKQQTE